MAKFLFVYYGGKMAATPEEGAKSMKAWTDWFTKLGKAVVVPGEPTMPGKMVDKKGIKDGFVGVQPVGGYSVIEAKDIKAAAELAKGSPLIADGGSVAVYATMMMDMPKK